MTANYPLSGINVDWINPNRTWDAYFGPQTAYTTPVRESTTPLSLQTGVAKYNYQAQNFSGGASMVAATATVEVKVASGDTPTAGTHVRVGFNLPVNGVNQLIIGDYEIQSGDTTVTAVATGIKTTLQHMTDSGVALPTGGTWESTDLNATDTELRTAMQAFFGTTGTDAFSTSSGVLTCTADATGTGGNAYEIFCETTASIPSPVPAFSSSVPTSLGLRQFGSAVALNNETGANLVQLTNSQSLSIAAQFTGRENPQFTFTSHELLNDVRRMGMLSSSLGITFNGTSITTSQTGQAKPVKYFAFYAVQSGLYTSSGTQKDFIYAPKCTFSFGGRNFDVGDVQGVQITVSPIVSPTTALIQRVNLISAARS